MKRRLAKRKQLELRNTTSCQWNRFFVLMERSVTLSRKCKHCSLNSTCMDSIVPTCEDICLHDHLVHCGFHLAPAILYLLLPVTLGGTNGLSQPSGEILNKLVQPLTLSPLQCNHVLLTLKGRTRRKQNLHIYVFIYVKWIAIRRHSWTTHFSVPY